MPTPGQVAAVAREVRQETLDLVPDQRKLTPQKSWAETIAAFVKKPFELSLSPANILVPGGQGSVEIAKKAAAAAGEGAKNTGAAVRDAAGSATSGIKTGFAVGTGLIIILFGLFAYSQFRSAAGK